jgi:hypothetical protein
MWFEIAALVVIVIVLIGIAEKVAYCASTLSEIWEAYERDRERLKEVEKDLYSMGSSLDAVESSLDTVSSLLAAIDKKLSSRLE